jgi:hypothetical protein
MAHATGQTRRRACEEVVHGGPLHLVRRFRMLLMTVSPLFAGRAFPGRYAAARLSPVFFSFFRGSIAFLFISARVHKEPYALPRDRKERIFSFAVPIREVGDLRARTDLPGRQVPAPSCLPLTAWQRHFSTSRSTSRPMCRWSPRGSDAALSIHSGARRRGSSWQHP